MITRKPSPPEVLLTRLARSIGARLLVSDPMLAGRIDCALAQITAASVATCAKVVANLDAGAPSIAIAFAQVPPPRREKPAKLPSHRKQREKKIWTAARTALLRQAWPAGVAVHDLLAELNALPGDPVPKVSSVSIAAARFGVKRPLNFFYRRNGKPPAKSSTHKRGCPESIFTDAALAALRATYPTEPDLPAVIRAVRAAGGRDYTVRQVYDRAKYVGLKRPPRVKAPPKPKPVSRGYVCKWSKSTCDIMARDYPAGVLPEDIIAAVAAADGTVMTQTHFSALAFYLKLTRPAGYAAKVAAHRLAARRAAGHYVGRKRGEKPAPVAKAAPVTVAAAVPVAVPAPARPAPVRDYSSVMWTPERNAYIRQQWPAGWPTHDMCRALNKMPGRTISNAHRIAVQAAALGVKRPVGFRAGNTGNVRTARPAVSPTPAPTAPRNFEHPVRFAIWTPPAPDAQRLPAPPLGAKRDPMADQIADFIARRGVTHCPTVALEATQATIPEADRALISSRNAAEAERLAAMTPRERMRAQSTIAITNWASRKRAKSLGVT
jgi:hypothetical protein